MVTQLMLHVAKMCLVPRDYFKIKSIVTVAITKAANRIKEAQAKEREKNKQYTIFFCYPFLHGVFPPMLYIQWSRLLYTV